ncbi:unnamed protein product [Amoebophrya sp. A120]|nr:unnamed protein product [Amoebophrya sp. A120]|eukprot:GSA120T00015859001.1
MSDYGRRSGPSSSSQQTTRNTVHNSGASKSSSPVSSGGPDTTTTPTIFDIIPLDIALIARIATFICCLLICVKWRRLLINHFCSATVTGSSSSSSSSSSPSTILGLSSPLNNPRSGINQNFGNVRVIRPPPPVIPLNSGEFTGSARLRALAANANSGDTPPGSGRTGGRSGAGSSE